MGIATATPSAPQALRDQIVACQYLHEQHLDKFSDHSALTAGLSLTPLDGLLACDPAATLTPPALF